MSFKEHNKINNNAGNSNNCMQLTFELISVVMSDTFWVANPPILMALCVAVEAILEADEENNDQP